MKLLEGLNPSQIEAVKHIDGAMLILAGAGSGKTKTITTRLAYLIDEVGIDASSTLTLTFTNKAAQVMKTRALSLIKNQVQASPLLCTFHKFGLLFLRMYIEKLERKNNFIVIDTDDQKKIIKEFLGTNSKLSSSSVLNAISNFKNDSKNLKEVFEELELIKTMSNQAQRIEKFEQIAKAYQFYQEMLLRHNFVDFDDLLLLSNEILEKDEAFKKEQSKFYHYITVDEYQDTNALQYRLIQNLCSAHQNICVVGDDDQSIYAWRGARIENILNFQSEFDHVKLVKLEQNYRSSKAILNAANALIANNQKRLGKKLLCTREAGDEVQIYRNLDEKSESLQIAKAIKKLLQKGVEANEIAILYRVNALSRSLEEALMKEKIAFKILSGMRFYERAEIKDIIAYLRFFVNTNDDFSFKRIINRPKRGFGQSSLSKLEEHAKKNQISLFEALCNVQGSGFFSKKLDEELGLFIENVKAVLEAQSLDKVFDVLESKFKLKEFYQSLDNGEDRVRNVDEFYAEKKEGIKEGLYESLEDILNEISLLSDQDEAFGDSVFLMSIHASKGLEFDHVFIVGLEENFFPLTSEESDIEEERRLAYVAITRAKKSLVLSAVNSRFYRGSRNYLHESRFLNEAVLKQDFAQKESLNLDFKKGDLIKHKIFGIGRVIDVSKSGADFRLVINFGGIERTILSSFVEKVV
ncbi:ATP-dependent DNA helicase [Campylobacter sp. MIT 99-7217]|uniref:ATP-dependent helicase n=1 Tax=Campylobacter sp. MIT 99-7217 TaxID=535091 RepID=UPI00115BF59A|nr:UvrD-helicase domain-containing protein [Campylobacter sp. MIT 99-7217]TQR29340.1 ATP-dependent DNA helicase [Campylobacter sp. MIT 99-7217]